MPACSPRTRGWTAVNGGNGGAQASCSPRTRGWTVRVDAHQSRQERVPRARGDGPPITASHIVHLRCSPRTRGWTGDPRRARGAEDVFPAHAGMDRQAGNQQSEVRGVPRARGDGPRQNAIRRPTWSCSPRTRGWTGLRPVGADARRCVPRARGDGPAGRQSTIRGERCSPRTRGWTAPKCHSPSNVVVFPAHAGMDRPPAGGCRRSTVCSPRTRGWTITPPVLEARQLVFPAHAGMDRPLKTVYRGAFGVPRARGDGPSSAG